MLPPTYLDMKEALLSLPNDQERQCVSEYYRLLKATDMTVQQISQELNFPNPSFFGKYFKNLTGIFPQKYRKE